jgi:aminoglycoside phosphotransferase (APT) family kinase protein
MTEFGVASEQGDAPKALRALVEDALGKHSLAWTKPDTGLTPAHRFIVTFEDGARAFVKGATTPTTASQLRNEHFALQHASPMAPRILAWLDNASMMPVLLTEALDGHWPATHRGVNWRPGDLDLVFSRLAELRLRPAPVGLAPNPPHRATDWADLATLSSETVASARWFERNAPVLAAAEAALDRNGSAFVHGDMRSDNICVMSHGVGFVDWAGAHAGSPEEDLASFLPTAHLEGGPRPYDVFPDGGGWAVALAGEAFRLAREEAAPDWLRRVARRLAASNLDWAVASLGLEPRERTPQGD